MRWLLPLLALTACRPFEVCQPVAPVEPPTKLLAAQLAGRQVELKDATGGPVKDLRFSAGELVVVTDDGEVRVGDRTSTIGNRYTEAISSERTLLALRNRGNADIVDARDGTMLLQLPGHRAQSEYAEALDAAAFRGDLIATGDDTGRLRLWSLSKGHMLGYDRPGRDRLIQLAFTPSGDRIAAAIRGQGAVQLFDTITGDRTDALHTHDDDNYAIDFSADGTRMVAAGFSGKITMWNRVGCRSHTLDGRDEEWPPFASDVVLSPDGSVVVAALDDGIALWDARSGELITRAVMSQAHGSARMVRSVDISPDQRQLAAGTIHGVMSWRLPELE